MVWQKLTKYNEAVNFTNISNAFQTDHLQDITFLDISRYHRFILTGMCYCHAGNSIHKCDRNNLSI